MVDTTVRVDLPELLQAVAHRLALRGVAGEPTRSPLVKAPAAQDGKARLFARMVTSGPGAAFDGDPTLGPETIEDAPERWLADARPHQVPDSRLRKSERLAHQQLQNPVFNRVLHSIWISIE